MNGFKKSFLCKQPLTYYVSLGSKEKGRDWICIDPIVTDRPVYAPEGVVAIFSSNYLSQAKHFGTPLKLICLSCFFHILRRGNRVRSALLDGKFCLTIMARTL